MKVFFTMHPMKTWMKNTIVLILLILAYTIVWIVMWLGDSDDGRSSSSRASFVPGSSSSSSVNESGVEHLVMDDPQYYAKEWKKYSDPNLNVEFDVPAEYFMQKGVPVESFIGDVPVLERLLQAPSQSHAVTVRIIRTDDAGIMKYITSDYPIMQVNIADKNLKMYERAWMMNPIGFVMQESPDYILLEFSPELQRHDMERILRSFKVSGRAVDIYIPPADPDSTPLHVIINDQEIAKKKWVSYSDDTIGISFDRPESYVVAEAAGKTTFIFNGQGFPVTTALLRSGLENDSPSITAYRTHDPLILHMFNSYHPFENIEISGKSVKRFHWDGALHPVGYLFQESPDFVALLFAPGFSEQTTEKIISSLKIINR